MLAALEKIMPEVPKVYFGDTLHLPYGDKSDQAIVGYSKEIVSFLKDQGCELIVIACNSASAAAGAALEAAFPELAFVNVIDPVVAHLATLPEGHVGLLGTRATVRSGAYTRRLAGTGAKVRLTAMATPLLVPLIEDGFLGTGIDEQVLAHYLADSTLSEVTALVPGCTHYPLLEGVAARLRPDLMWVDAPRIVAQAVQHAWKERLGNDSAQGNGQAKVVHYLSDKTESFLEMARTVFGIQAHWHEVNFR